MGRRLTRLSTSAGEVVRSLEADPESEALRWARSLAEQCRDAAHELTLLAPWVQPLPLGQIFDGFPYLREIPTLRRLACLDEEVLPLIGGEAAVGRDAESERAA